MKFLAISPDHRTLVLECTAGAVAFDARTYAAAYFTRTGKCEPVSPQTILVHETGAEAREDVRLRYVGNAAKDKNDLRRQVATKRKDGTWTEWEDGWREAPRPRPLHPQARRRRLGRGEAEGRRGAKAAPAHGGGGAASAGTVDRDVGGWWRTSVNIEWELDEKKQRTGRWRRRQFYALPGVKEDRRVPSDRKDCEWRTGVPR